MAGGEHGPTGSKAEGEGGVKGGVPEGKVQGNSPVGDYERSFGGKEKDVRDETPPWDR
ncbi:hypothetical protein [Actinomadura flavalba]|uniref:hypothetical protein n=1 Tax=Actinomadura flavalba TaxID=1120938 RepID=UPI0003611DCF|nr:hypothetical protein [Actinomadura flavalba]